MKKIIDEAQKEIAETGFLSVHTRNRLLLTFGPANVTDNEPCTLTDTVKKRAQLALECGKKVSKVWSCYDPEDKRPQALLRQTAAYLQGKCTADKLEKLLEKTDFMPMVEEEAYSTAPVAALTAWNGAVTALHDEPLLSPDHMDCQEHELECYDWDAAWCAALAWAGRDEDAGTGKKRVEEMKFWAWYLEQAAALLGEESYRFPKKEIEKFKDQQEPPRSVPEQADLEQFVQYMGIGDFQYCVSRRNGQFYAVHAMPRSIEAVCLVCGAPITRPAFWNHVLYLEENFPKKGPEIQLIGMTPTFRCPNHPKDGYKILGKEWNEYINQKAAWKRYLAVPGRAEAFLAELKRRAVHVIDIGECFISVDDLMVSLCKLPIMEGVRGIRWLDQEMGELEIDLTLFGPEIYFHGLSLEEFRLCSCSSDKIQTEEDGALWITMDEHWVRCELNEEGVLTRVVIRGRFQVRFTWEQEKRLSAGPRTDEQNKALGEVLELPAERVTELSLTELCSHFAGLTQPEALALQGELQERGFACELWPSPCC